MRYSNAFKDGKMAEALLDKYFQRRGWHITQTTPEEEREKYWGDRKYVKDNKIYYIEYKYDARTFKTGNIFLETISVDTADTPGWVYTCRADYIFYACWSMQEILVFTPATLRKNIENFKLQYRTVATAAGLNNGYRTHGVLVPYAEAKKIAKEIIELKEDIWKSWPC